MTFALHVLGALRQIQGYQILKAGQPHYSGSIYLHRTIKNTNNRIFHTWSTM